MLHLYSLESDGACKSVEVEDARSSKDLVPTPRSPLTERPAELRTSSQEVNPAVRVRETRARVAVDDQPPAFDLASSPQLIPGLNRVIVCCGATANNLKSVRIHVRLFPRRSPNAQSCPASVISLGRVQPKLSREAGERREQLHSPQEAVSDCGRSSSVQLTRLDPLA